MYVFKMTRAVFVSLFNYLFFFLLVSIFFLFFFYYSSSDSFCHVYNIHIRRVVRFRRLGYPPICARVITCGSTTTATTSNPLLKLQSAISATAASDREQQDVDLRRLDIARPDRTRILPFEGVVSGSWPSSCSIRTQRHFNSNRLLFDDNIFTF